MKIPLIRQGEGPAAALERHHNERDALRQKLDRIARDTAGTDTRPIHRRRTTETAGGDHRALRGIPAIGRGVNGAIPGTSPHSIQ